MREQQIISSLENRHMNHRRRTIYTALEEVDFIWDWDTVERVIEMWKNGVSFVEIAKHVKRDPLELALLLTDLTRKRKIKAREYKIKNLVKED